MGGERVDPRVFVSLGLLSIWSGRRDKLLRRFVRRAKLGLDKRTLLSAAGLLWMSISPASFRALINFASARRAAGVRSKLSPDEPFEWSPRSRP